MEQVINVHISKGYKFYSQAPARVDKGGLETTQEFVDRQKREYKKHRR